MDKKKQLLVYFKKTELVLFCKIHNVKKIVLKGEILKKVYKKTSTLHKTFQHVIKRIKFSTVNAISGDN